MKQSFHLLITAVFILILGTSTFAQDHEMYLSAPTEATYINDIIMGDTLSTGERADLDRVYVLQRGGVWFFNGVIRNIEWPLRIKAEDGDGPLPIIYGTIEQGGTNVPIDFIDAQGDIYLTNIAVNGIFDLDPEYASFTYGAPKELVVFWTAGDYTMTVKGCIFENAYQANLRTFGGIRSVNVTDCIFANNGTAPWQSISNGRAVDLRNTSCDTLLMVNNTFVNTNDRIVRHIASTARLNTFIFEHNTIVNNGGRYGVLAMGLIGDKVQIRNNLFVDPMAFGADTISQRQWDFKENGEPFSETITDKVKMSWLYSQHEETAYGTNFDIKNNYWYNSPEVAAVWETIKTQFGNSTLQAAPFMTDFIESQLDDPSTAFTELTNGITFTDAPGPMDGMVYWNLSPAPEGCGGNSNGGTAFQDFDRRTTVYHRDTLDCSYPTASAAYTGAQGGYPAGDLNWFPTKKAEWEAAGGWTDIEYVNDIPTDFSLSQNYPNPFNPSTKISFSIPVESKVKLQVFDILGRQVATLVNGMQQAGTYSVDFNASDLASGVYVYKLSTQDYTVSKKMLLMK
jgi:hypothetical protein